MSTETKTKSKSDSKPAAKKRAVSIRPYIDSEQENMGLEKYGMVLHDGCRQSEPITCLEKNGVKKYVTGLDEFAEEILKSDEETRKLKIKNIRENVIFLEKSLGANEIKIDDEHFWDKVKTVRPDNFDFWNNVFVEAGNEPVFLDPLKPEDLIKICAIEAGGINMVAKSYEDAKTRPTPPKFYLDRYEETAASKTTLTRLQNDAIFDLQTVSKSDPTKLFFVAKCIDADSAQYKKSTSNDVIYSNMDAYIKGKGTERIVRKACEAFSTAVKLPIEDLTLKAIVRDAVFYSLITIKGDGLMYHDNSGSMMGRNVAECAAYLKKSINDKVLADLQEEVEKLWQ